MREFELLIPPISQEDADRLGNQLKHYERPSQRRESVRRESFIFAVIGIAVAVLIIVTGVHSLFHIASLLLLMMAWGVWPNSGVFAIELYDRGAVTFDGKGKPRVYLWQDVNFGETEWEGRQFEFSINTAIPREGISFTDTDLNGSVRKFRELVYETAYPILRKRWAKADRENLPADQDTAVVKREGVYFKKVGKTLPWSQLEEFDIDNDSWELYFVLPNGKPFKTNLIPDEVPWVYLLLRFAEEVRRAQANMALKRSQPARPLLDLSE